MSAPHERHGNADKAGAVDEVEDQPALHAPDIVYRHHARQRAANGHGQNDHLAGRNAGIAGGVRVVSKRAHGIAEFGMPDQPIAEDQRQNGNDDGQVGWRAAEQREEFSQARNAGNGLDRRAFVRVYTLGLEYARDDVAHHRGSDEVEENGGDDDVTAALGLQHARDIGPEGPECRAEDNHQREHDSPMQTIKRQGDEDDAQPGDIGLTFTADIEHAGMIGQRHGQTGEDEIGGVIERIAKAHTIAEGAIEHDAHGLERVLANGQNNQAPNEEGQNDIEDRQQGHIGPTR